ncbi:MAG: hypothetical protein QM486_05295 [Flavobacteriaceae bacterium]
MKVQILPNWCKKLGFFIFLVTSIISGGDGFIDGFMDGQNNYGSVNKSKYESNLFSNYFGENLLHIFSVLAIVGLIIYMISKEKIEDDYINKLRLESFQLTAIIGMLLSLVLFTFTNHLELTLDYFVVLFLWIYFIVFFIKKNN